MGAIPAILIGAAAFCFAVPFLHPEDTAGVGRLMLGTILLSVGLALT